MISTKLFREFWCSLRKKVESITKMTMSRFCSKKRQSKRSNISVILQPTSVFFKQSCGPYGHSNQFMLRADCSKEVILHQKYPTPSDYFSWAPVPLFSVFFFYLISLKHCRLIQGKMYSKTQRILPFHILQNLGLYSKHKVIRGV